MSTATSSECRFRGAKLRDPKETRPFTEFGIGIVWVSQARTLISNEPYKLRGELVLQLHVQVVDHFLQAIALLLQTFKG